MTIKTCLFTVCKLICISITATWISCQESQSLFGQEPFTSLHAAEGQDDPPDFSVIDETGWQDIERSVDRGIDYLLSVQHSDGSFGVRVLERPAITALVCMSMISRGHVPDASPSASEESKTIIRGTEFILSKIRGDGMIGHTPSTVSDELYPRYMVYNHAICGLFLTEIYGMTDPSLAARIEPVVVRALNFVRVRQQRPIPATYESTYRGGWRYLEMPPGQLFFSDLSVTSWIIMFMRSAENAGFDVPVAWAKEGLDFVLRCYDKRMGTFMYVPNDPMKATRGMMGAGVVCLFLTGHKDDEMEERCSRWMLNRPFRQYNVGIIQFDHFHYGAYYQSQAAMQIGGGTWEKFYPNMTHVLIANQNSNGSWQPEHKHPELGEVYSTTMSILALTTPYQLLPIYQR